MNLETAIKIKNSLKRLVKQSRKGCKGHWNNFGFNHRYGSYDCDMPLYWYEVVSNGRKGVLDLMPQISAILNKHVEAWNISVTSEGVIVINIP